MWQLRDFSAADRKEIRATMDEVLLSISRYFIGIVEVFLILCMLIIAGNAPSSVMARLLVMVIAGGLVAMLSYRMLEQHYLGAHLLWQSSVILAIILAAWILEKPGVVLFLAIVPLLTVITLGWAAGAGAQILVTGLVWVVLGNFSAHDLPEPYIWVFLIFGCLTATLGGAATSRLVLLAEWSFFNFNQAQKNLQEAREQRVELKETQEDLVKANHELARLTERLKVLQHVAEESRQAKAEFVANVSHELRTPLNMIIGFTEVIARSPHLYGGKLPASLMTDITAIQRNSRHLLDLVNDVLDLSQVEAGRMALSREWTDLPEIIQNAQSVVKSLFDSKGLYLEASLAPELPQVFCDKVRIREVLINLLSNAGRFTKQGGVKIACWQENDQVLVSTTDSGPGIPKEDLDKLFEPFQQLDSSIRRKYGGSGLGLTISKQFVEMHGGKMWLNSQPGEGTVFTFSLPVFFSLSQEAEPGHTPRRALIPGDEYGFSLRTRPVKTHADPVLPRMVILEKEQSLHKLALRYLPDIEVVQVDTAQAAIAELNRSPAQALLVNIAPREEALLDELVQVPYGTPIVSCWVPGEAEAAKNLRVIDYLVKPVTIEKLQLSLASLKGKLNTILVADDEPDELHLFARMLESEDAQTQILQVTNGKRALSMLRSRKPDVLLLDLMMPVMDGFQVLEEKQKDADIRDIPVIVISSRDPNENLIMSNSLRVIYHSGLTLSKLAKCVQAVSQVLAPAIPTPALSEKNAA